MSAAATESTGKLKARRSDEAEARLTHLKRLVACLFAGVVLALMVGDQEGTQQDFYYGLRQSVFHPRIFVFLAIGVLMYLAITFGERLRPYLGRPGLRPLGMGALTVVISLGLLHWTDSPEVGDGKFGTLADAARDTPGLNYLARLFFGHGFSFLPWVVLVVIAALALTAVVRRVETLAYVTAGLAVLVGIWAMFAAAEARTFIGFPDHSTGGAVCMLGYFVIAVAAIVSARSSSEVANREAFIDKVMGWRPGFPLVAAGAIIGLEGVLDATWFSPGDRNTTLSGTAGLFSNEPVHPLTTAYLGWLGLVLFFGTGVLAFAATYLRNRILALVTIAVGLISLALTLFVTYNFSKVAANAGFNGASQAWDNLGTGSWLTCAALSLMASGGFIAVKALAADAAAKNEAGSDQVGNVTGIVRPGLLGTTTILVMVTAALFVPPTTTDFWQTVLVTEIGIYVLLAVGLNVVVGWAGLLDLGFIAFYAIGSYTTAYFTGRLPVKPFIELSPLLCIPFAIVVCLLAGVALGAPTLRLRGDYLAIVTLGFGEIIRVIANNANGFTNGPRGAFNIPTPEIKIGPIDLKWGGDSALQYWYLLLVLTTIVVILFNRLEHSRLGRAWAAVREDEVAAQATGIDTIKVKLLAFAIGASTSGVAGVFFASQVGSFTPEAFTVQTSILIVAYVVFGGMGSLAGAMAGAAVLTWLPEFLKDQVPAEDRQMWIGAVIMLMMVFRPAGLIPARRRKAELNGLGRAASAESSAVPASEGM